MLTEFLFYIYPRPGFSMQPVYTGMIPLTGVETVPAASTEIRAKIKKGANFSDFLIKQVAQYIEDKGLYGSC
jgi:nicotinic acid mononucleotide adenylyltransferase